MISIIRYCQCEKYSDSEYFSNTVKSTSKSYQSLKEDSQSSDDENKIKSYPRNGKHEFGNKFMNWKIFHSYQAYKFVCISLYHQVMVATNAIEGNAPVKAWQERFKGVEIGDASDYNPSWTRKPIIYNLIGLNLWVKITSESSIPSTIVTRKCSKSVNARKYLDRKMGVCQIY